jgi:hypothetical protein
MKSLFLFRVYALLKRLVAEHKRTADAIEKLAYIEALRWDMEKKSAERDLVRRARGPKHTEFGSFDINEANRRWQQEQEASTAGVDVQEKA